MRHVVKRVAFIFLSPFPNALSQRNDGQAGIPPLKEGHPQAQTTPHTTQGARRRKRFQAPQTKYIENIYYIRSPNLGSRENYIRN